MINKSSAFALALCSVMLCAPAAAAGEARPPADPAQPVTTLRVGGSPADAAFREAQLKSGAVFQDARSACRAKPRAERGACMSAARAELRHAHAEAKAAHDAAKATR